VVFDEKLERPGLSVGPRYSIFTGEFFSETLLNNQDVVQEDLQLAVDRSISTQPEMHLKTFF
jgi:hypothetical protein